MLPADYNFPSHYMNDGLKSFTITIEDDNGPVNLTGATVKMQLSTINTNSHGDTIWTFSTEEGADGSLSIEPDGVIRFAEIKSWTIEARKYYYDLQVTDSDGFVTTYLKGTWEIVRDITS